jgi:quercetin dioxygenase-like cupin family protein
MIDLKIKHHFSGREYAKQMTLPAGHFAVTHEHVYDHISILASGHVVVELDGVKFGMQGPDAVVIPAGKKHRIEAITDSVWFCVHATDETDSDKVDSVLIREN